MESNSLYRIKFNFKFEAAHRFVLVPTCKCATPHGHSWGVTLFLEGDAKNLDKVFKMGEFDDLKPRFKQFINDTVDHSFMHHMDDPIMESLTKNIPNLRALPFPGDPTTELIAALFLAKALIIHETYNPNQPIKPIALEIQETKTNHVYFESKNLEPFLKAILPANIKGWWQNTDPHDRSLEK